MDQQSPENHDGFRIAQQLSTLLHSLLWKTHQAQIAVVPEPWFDTQTAGIISLELLLMMLIKVKAINLGPSRCRVT